LLCFFPTRLLLDPDQDVGWRAEFLKCHFAKPQAGKPVAKAVDVGGTGGADLDQDAALEVDAEVQPLDRDKATETSMNSAVTVKQIRRKPTKSTWVLSGTILIGNQAMEMPS